MLCRRATLRPYPERGSAVMQSWFEGISVSNFEFRLSQSATSAPEDDLWESGCGNLRNLKLETPPYRFRSPLCASGIKLPNFSLGFS